mmetsp:Transcript_37396/g.94361  ORF Transcript_37396/g.94361 Transcript_37396/m.94361 type:complete len:104 (-) Transcript_37396:140-451(-)
MGASQSVAMGASGGTGQAGRQAHCDAGGGTRRVQPGGQAGSRAEVQAMQLAVLALTRVAGERGARCAGTAAAAAAGVLRLLGRRQCHVCVRHWCALSENKHES